MDPDILAIGEAMVEFNQGPGGDTGDAYRIGHGGDTSNTVIAAARQGVRTGYLSAVGVDRFGDSLIELWMREGVDVSAVRRDREAPTGVYFVTHGPDGHAFSYLRAGSAASRIDPVDLPLETIARARILHASGISQAISTTACDAVFAAMAHARASGARVSYDTNLRLKLWPLERARAIIHAAVAMSDIVLPSLDDATALTGLDDPDAIVDFYLRLGPTVVALKLGPSGALVATPGERRRIPGHAVEAVDATGAGDTFDGAFLARTVAGDTPFEAARYANAAAAIATEGFGAVAPIPYRETVEAFLLRAARN